MRILSQDGRIDLPYEVISVELVGGTAIVSQTYLFGSGADNFTTIAEYSTEAKARKAMEMLREAYCGAVYMKHADYEIEDIDLSQELEKKIREEMMKPHFLDVKINNPVIECKVFRFPADDEVEV